jgi:hypothetical protein
MAAPTQAEVEQFIKTHELKPGTIHILTFDVAAFEISTLIKMGREIYKRHGIALYMLGYDAASNESPLQLFEVKPDVANQS